jgi:hypothetical protein
MKVGIASLLLFLLLSLVAATPCIACQCGQIPDAKQEISMVSIVVAGRVEGIREEAISYLFSKKIVRISVERVWKGNAPSELILAVGFSDCDYVQFQAGERYLIFVEASRSLPGAWSASKCGPTKPLAQAGAEVRLLGPGRSTLPAPTTSNGAGLTRRFSTLIVLAAAGAASALLLWRLRKISSR